MSLYTLKVSEARPSLRLIADLEVEECTNPELLSAMGTVTVDEVNTRWANDHVAYVAYMGKVPAAFGWMARRRAFIGELNHHLVLPYRHRYLWNFRTMEPFRGLGIYPALLQRVMEFEKSSADTFWIIHAPENVASLRGIQKAGFQYVGKLYNTGMNTIVEETAVSKATSEFLTEMGIGVSGGQPASCWNCSSPYLKKRKNSCCCAPQSELCVGGNLTALTQMA